MRGKSEEGIALIAVLWALTLLSIIAASLSWDARTNARIARNMADNAAARAAADAGIQRAILDLLGPGADLVPPGADRTLLADGTAYAWHFADSDVRISVQDESGKINLNDAPEALLAALLVSVGVDPDKSQSLADAIADFRDADNLTHLHGAEAADYRAAGLAWGPTNAPFEDVEELQQVLGMTADVYELVAPDLTVYTYGTKPHPRLVMELPTSSFRQVGSRYVLGVSGIAYSIRAEAKSSNGGAFVREAVVQMPDIGVVKMVVWREGAECRPPAPLKARVTTGVMGSSRS